MSLKRIPSVGKSLMSRIFPFISAISIARYLTGRMPRRASAPECPKGGTGVTPRSPYVSENRRSALHRPITQLTDKHRRMGHLSHRGTLLARHRRQGFWRRPAMLLPEQVQRLLERALAEFAPEWQVASGCTELSLNNADHWVSGLGTFGLVLRNRQSKAAKILGWRNGLHERDLPPRDFLSRAGGVCRPDHG